MTTATDLWLAESPLDIIAGSTLVYSITFTGKTAGSSPLCKIYRNGVEVSSTVLSGVSTISNGTPPVMVLPTISGLVGGETYVLVAQATVDGQTEMHKLLIRCVKPGAEQ